MNRKKTVLQICGSVFSFIISFAIVFTLGGGFVKIGSKTKVPSSPSGIEDKESNYTETDNTQETTEPKTEIHTFEESSAYETDSETESEQPSESTESEPCEEEPSEQIQTPLEQPEKFLEILSASSLTTDSLDALNCKQLISVQSQGSSAYISFYQKNESGVWENLGLDIYGFVGRRGVSADSYEGSLMTPAGLFPVGDAFYIYDSPPTGLNSFQVTADTYWVDDPNSKFYNQRVEGTSEKDWSSAEHMIDYASYRYGFVINFNMQNTIPGKGSAIFFHCGSNPTAGCVAVSQDMMLAYLSRLNSSMSPYILIV